MTIGGEINPATESIASIRATRLENEARVPGTERRVCRIFGCVPMDYVNVDSAGSGFDHVHPHHRKTTIQLYQQTPAKSFLIRWVSGVYKKFLACGVICATALKWRPISLCICRVRKGVASGSQRWGNC